MNMQQKNYTIKRIEEIAKRKDMEISNHKVDAESMDMFTADEAFAAIKAGKGYDVSSSPTGHRWLYECVLPVGYEKAKALYNIAYTSSTAAKILARKQLQNLVSTVSDSVMIGDSEDAAAALARLEAFDYEY